MQHVWYCILPWLNKRLEETPRFQIACRIIIKYAEFACSEQVFE